MKHLTPIFLLIFITACGFHLRGYTPGVKEKEFNIYIRAENATRVTAEIKEQISSSKIKLASAPDESRYVLFLFEESFDRSILSVSATTGKVEEYKVTLNVRMSVSTPAGEDLIINELVSNSRDFAFDEEAILGKYSEEQVLEEELIKQVASSIIHRLNTLSDQ